MSDETRKALVAIAAFLEMGGSRVCNLHESPGSWASEQLMRIVEGKEDLNRIIWEEDAAIVSGEGHEASR